MGSRLCSTHLAGSAPLPGPPPPPLQDWLAAHRTVPPFLEALGVSTALAGLGGCKWEVQTAKDLPGGYRVSVGLRDGRRVSVRGDALIWVE